MRTMTHRFILIFCWAILSIAEVSAQDKAAPDPGAKTTPQGDSQPEAKKSSEKKRKTRKAPPSPSGDASAPPKDETAEAGESTSVPDAESQNGEGVAKISATAKLQNEQSFKGMQGANVRGAIGLDQVFAADVGDPGLFRLRVSLSSFDAEDFPVVGQSNFFLATDFAFAYTPMKYAEVFGAIRSTSNSNDAGRPALIQTQGDFYLGAKGAKALNRDLTVGGLLGLRFLSGVGTAGIDSSSTSVEFRGLASLDLRNTANVPVLLHGNLGYYVENSEALLDSEDGEPSTIEEFGLQVARYDRVNIGLGAEFPVEPRIRPYVEYNLGVPILVELARRGEGTGDYGVNSIPHSVTAGLRGFVMEQLPIDAAIRLGLSSTPYTGVPATPPWMFVLGVGYVLDPDPPVVERIVEVEAKTPPPPAVPEKVRVSGQVIDATSSRPIESAQISYPDASALSLQSTNADGRFGGYMMKPGDITVMATAEGYKPNSTVVALALNQKPSLTISLEPDPAQQKVQVEIRVFDERGRPVDANVKFSGKRPPQSGMSREREPFRNGIKPGRYGMTISAIGMKDDVRTLEVKVGEPVSLRVVLKGGKGKRAVATRKPAPISQERPRRLRSSGGGLAKVTTKGITLKKKVSFTEGSAKLDTTGRAVLDSVAKGLKEVGAIKRVQVGVHTARKGPPSASQTLSQQRAKAVIGYLVKRGVPPSRLRAKAFGASKPLAPNITRRGRAKNQRVVFRVLETK